VHYLLGLVVIKTILQVDARKSAVAITILLPTAECALLRLHVFGLLLVCIRASSSLGGIELRGFMTVIIYPIAFGYGFSYPFAIGCSVYPCLTVRRS